MTESLLSYIWRYQLYNKFSLATTTGQKLKIYTAGAQEMHAGPDFFNARINIDGITWAGNIEIHLAASSWTRHKHNANRAFESVILQVVLVDDEKAWDSMGRAVPCLELGNRIDPLVLSRLQYTAGCVQYFIPCEKLLYKVDKTLSAGWLHRLGLERIQLKTDQVNKHVPSGTPRSVLQYLLISGFSTPPNSFPFNWLASRVNYNAIDASSGDTLRIEAMLQGQAGFLRGAINTNGEETFFINLKSYYKKDKKRFGLEELDPVAWKFARTRPVNFPSLRLSQLSVLLACSGALSDALEKFIPLKDLQHLIQIRAASYWDTRCRFGDGSTLRPKTVGKEMVRTLLINVFSIYYMALAQKGYGNKYLEKGLEIQRACSSESNNVVSKFRHAGLKTSTALETQGLLQLKSYYCDLRKCLICSIGNEVLRGKDGKKDFKLL